MADLNMIIKRGKIAGKPTSLSYEFSCNNTPPFPISIFSSHKKNRNERQHLTNYNPPLAVNDCDGIVINSAVLDMMTNTSPMRITDSPIPVTNGGEDGHVDEAAEKFIRRNLAVRRRRKMEQNLPVITKKLWSLMRVMFFMLKKGIFKAQIMADLSMIIKRGKIAGKPTSLSYESSCNNTPPYPLSIFSSHKKNRNERQHLTNYNPPLAVNDCDGIVINSAVLDMMTNTSPMRITDSPIPVTNGGEHGHVDEAAEKFIRRFYNDLRREN
nr:hypothetical protein [Tanacetum cinerariifolium]